MRRPIINLLKLAFQALAELAEGDEGVEQTSAGPQQSELQQFLADLAGRVGGTDLGARVSDEPVEAAPIIDGMRVPADPVVDDSVIPAVENGVPLLECPELHRQRNEARRRKKLRDDPVQALSVVSYWLLHLTEQPLRAEEWTRCVECVPGTASGRFNRALNLGMSELQLYAAYYDECMKALQVGKDKAEQMARHAASIGADEAIDATQLLDADRIGRILFQLGDRPAVEALTEVPPPSGDVRQLGPDHIEGPLGTKAEVEGEELMTIEELERLHPLPQDDTQEIETPEAAATD